jgi:hypothetical protein
MEGQYSPLTLAYAPELSLACHPHGAQAMEEECKGWPGRGASEWRGTPPQAVVRARFPASIRPLSRVMRFGA